MSGGISTVRPGLVKALICNRRRRPAPFHGNIVVRRFRPRSREKMEPVPVGQR